MEYKNSILDLIGNTPLVKMNRIVDGLKPQVFAKIEFQNPGGSLKDRIGYHMILEAEKSGDLKPGGTVIEATSGNTGIGIALTAAYRGYRSIMVVTDKVSVEKVNYLKALGCEVIVTSNGVDHDSPEYYCNIAKRLSKEIPNSVFLYQYNNPANPEAHYKTTGPEIWNQTDGKVTHVVLGMGTGGTISGTGKYLKEMNPDIQIIGAEPEGSVYKHFKENNELMEPNPYLIEGVGQEYIPPSAQMEYVDKVYSISDADSVKAAVKLAREEAIFSGGSTGTVVKAMLEEAEHLTKDDIVVFVVCDTGERYLSKIYNDEWLTEQGLPVNTNV